MGISKKQPKDAIGYLVCPNIDKCKMAKKCKSWIWDFGPGSKSDECTCFECDFRFMKARTRKKGSRTPSTDGDKFRAPSPKSKARASKGIKKSPDDDKDANRDLLVAVAANLNELLAIRENGGSLQDMQLILQPEVPESPTYTAVEKLQGKIQHYQKVESEKLQKIENLKKQLVAEYAFLETHAADLTRMQTEHDEMLLALQTKPTEPALDVDYEHVGEDVYMKLEGIESWTQHAKEERKQKLLDQLQQVELAIACSVSPSSANIVEVKEEPTQASEASYGMRAAHQTGSLYSPYPIRTKPGSVTSTPGHPNDGPLSDFAPESSLSLDEQLARGAERYGGGLSQPSDLS